MPRRIRYLRQTSLKVCTSVDDTITGIIDMSKGEKNNSAAKHDLFEWQITRKS